MVTMKLKHRWKINMYVYEHEGICSTKLEIQL